jgi:NAD(P)-dependent dehydrogenase (short-subunit alcohol dehydrogenase family)
MAAYCASKAGVEAFAHCLRGEVAHHGVDVGVAYLSWTDTDMMRATEDDETLRKLQARLPWPANRTAPLDPAVERIADGIARRARHIYGQRWTRMPGWLPRPVVPAMAGRAGGRQIARLAEDLRSTSHLRAGLVGPGGRAAARSESAGPAGA